VSVRSLTHNSAPALLPCFHFNCHDIHTLPHTHPHSSPKSDALLSAK